MFSLEDRVKRIIGQQLDRDFDMLSPEYNLVNDLGADSLDIVELVMCLEEEFDMEILDDEAETYVKLDNTHVCINCIQNKCMENIK